MADADLYFDKVDLLRYFSGSECRKCGADSCRELVDKLRAGGCLPAELKLPAGKTRALEMALAPDSVLPRVPQVQLPRPVEAGLFELNDPEPGDPVLVSGNNEFTQQVLLAVLATTTSPFFVLFTDTRGDTLDMALILGSFTPDRVRRSIEEHGLAQRAAGSPLVLPGLAAETARALGEPAGFQVRLGPVCAAELPLYFDQRW